MNDEYGVSVNLLIDTVDRGLFEKGLIKVLFDLHHKTYIKGTVAWTPSKIMYQSEDTRKFEIKYKSVSSRLLHVLDLRSQPLRKLPLQRPQLPCTSDEEGTPVQNLCVYN